MIEFAIQRRRNEVMIKTENAKVMFCKGMGFVTRTKFTELSGMIVKVLQSSQNSPGYG